MSERLNKTSICSIVFLDIVEYSLKPVSEQIEFKDRFNSIISEAIKDVAQNDRIILDTGDGAAITLLGEPETALFISLTIRDGILKDNQSHPDFPLLVRIGINLGPVRVVSDINGRPNVIGDGINVAQRVMNFAEPNQILVSRSYYEIVSRLTNDMLKMFSYSGIKHDKHVREHEVYAILLHGDGAAAATEAVAGQSAAAQPHAWAGIHRNIVIAAGLILVAAIIGAFVLLRKPVVPQPVVAPVPANVVVPAQSVSPAQPASGKPVAKPVAAKPKKKPEPAVKKPVEAESGTQHETSPTEKKEMDSKKSGWDTFKQSVKQGTQEPTCTDAQRSMNQCK